MQNGFSTEFGYTSQPMAFDPQAVRRDLPSVLHQAYFNAGTFGPLPLGARRAMEAHLAESCEQGRIGLRGFQSWMEKTDTLRQAFAEAVDVDPEDLALMHCTTDGINAILLAMGLSAGDEVVTTTHEHPGLVDPLAEVSRAFGVHVRAVAPDEASLLAALTPKTRLVALSHVLWTTGAVLPLGAVAKAAHAHGAAVLVDGAQGAGALPFDLAGLGVDAYAMSGQKWLCGPSGTGALWIAPGFLPRLRTPWPWYLSSARKGAHAQPWPTARRLDATTLSLTSMAGAIAALRWVRDRFADGAHGYARSLAEYTFDRLSALKKIQVLRSDAPSTMLSFAVPGGDADRLALDLEAHGVSVRSIPGFGLVRVSVGFWNTEEDVERLVKGLNALLGTG